jgi:hypothetical protein
VIFWLKSQFENSVRGDHTRARGKDGEGEEGISCSGGGGKGRAGEKLLVNVSI